VVLEKEVDRDDNGPHLGQGIVYRNHIDMVGHHHDTRITGGQAEILQAMRQTIAAPIEFVKSQLIPFMTYGDFMRV